MSTAQEAWELASGDEDAPLTDDTTIVESNADEAPLPDDLADQNPEPSEIEKLASELGWKPETEWKGPKNGWTPASEYLRTTHQKLRASNEREHELKRSLRGTQRAAEDYAMRLERIERVTNQMMTEQESRHRAELRNYFEAQKKVAAKEGDDERYNDLIVKHEEAEAELDRQFAREPQANFAKQAEDMLNDPVVGKFLKEHPWVVADEGIYDYAFSVAQDLADAGYPKSMQIRAVKEALKEEYPERFTTRAQRQAPRAQDDAEAGEESAPSRVRDPDTGQFVPQRDAHLFQQQQVQRRAPAPVQSGSRVANSSRGTPEQTAWNSLPSEARATFKQQKDSGAFKGDIVRFAKIYHGDFGNVLD
jgi:signal recognition particle subunit SEC65